MVEIFSTNINDREIALKLIIWIQHAVPGCNATIDLEDCDRVLRVERLFDFDAQALIGLVAGLGYKAVVLPDEVPPPMDIDSLLKSA